MKEWNWEENNKIKIFPNEIFWGSGKKVHWICYNGHKWITSIRHRTLRGTNCPYCSNKKILSGYNDLKSQRPDLMKEWDYEKNILDPEKVAILSPKKAYWICPKGHKYEKSIYDRVKGKGCPVCVRSKSTSFPEQCFYYYIKKIYPDAINKYKDIFNNTMEIDMMMMKLNWIVLRTSHIQAIIVEVMHQHLLRRKRNNHKIQMKMKMKIRTQNLLILEAWRNIGLDHLLMKKAQKEITHLLSSLKY